jgi:undecaprenyl-diphosphatase
MLILEQLLQLEQTQGKAFFDFFLVIIQFGAILAVIIAFFKKLWPWGKSKTKEDKKAIWKTWLNILIACIPAGIVGIFLNDWLDSHFYNFLTVSITLIVYGIAFLVVENLIAKGKKPFRLNDVHLLTWKDALIIGLAQMLALIPGTSRSGVTIIAALLIGCNRSVSAEFSFYLAIPAMVVGSLYKGFKYFKAGNSLSKTQLGLIIVGCVVAFVVSIFVIKFFMSLVKEKPFTPFGYYRICFGCFLLVLYLLIIKDEIADRNFYSSSLAFFSNPDILRYLTIKA